MSTELRGLTASYPAAADYSTKQFYFMAVNSSGQAVLASAAGQAVIGVLQDKPSAADRPGCIMTHGITKVLAGGTVAAGALVATDAAGKAVTATKARTDTSDAGGATDPLIASYVVGIAKTGGASGEYIELQLLHAGAIATTAI